MTISSFPSICNAQYKVSQRAQKLGTTIIISAQGKDSLYLENTISNCWPLIDSLNLVFSDYEPESEVSQLSFSAGKNQSVNVSDPLYDVIITSKQLWEDSQGAFDITIGPLSKLWRRGFRRNIIPPKIEIEQARQSVGMQHLKTYQNDNRVKLTKPKMRIDLGGIAKGYIVDSVASYLQKKGINSFLIDAGGDIYVGTDEGDSVWNVRLENGEDLPFEQLKNKAIAASGSTYRYLESNGIRYSHIIDPRTGYGVTHSHNVTVIAENCIIADALASALSVLSEEKGRKLAEQYGAIVYYVK